MFMPQSGEAREQGKCNITSYNNHNGDFTHSHVKHVYILSSQSLELHVYNKQA